MMQRKKPASFLADFTGDIPRGIASRYINQQKAPQARWQSPDAIYESPALEYRPDNPGGKILLGHLGDKLIGIEDNRHILTVAGSRAGKSVTIIGNLLFYQGSVLATDLKGELANITAERRASLGQKVFILDPFKVTAERLARYRASYNPMAVLKPGSPTLIEDAGLIADALVVAAQNNDPHWDESAKHFIEGVILHVATDPRYEGSCDLVTVKKLIKNAMSEVADDDSADEYEEPLYALEQEMRGNAERLARTRETEDLADAIEGAANDFYEKVDKERSSVLSTVRRHTKFLDYSAVRSVVREHDFDLADLKRHAITIYLCLPASRLSASQRWLRVFVNQLLSVMEQERRIPDAPVLAVLDEFPVLGYMKQLEDTVGQVASFHTKLWVVLQDWNQGKALYGERWESFAANAGITQFFGNNDLTTTKYVSERLGRTPVAAVRSGEAGPEQRKFGLTGRSESVELHPLLSVDEVSRHFARNDRLKRQLVLWAGLHPMILQRVEYFDESSRVHRHFVGKYASR